MTSPENSSKSKPIIELLRQQIERGTELSETPNLKRAALEFWGFMVKSFLIRIYGKDDPQLKHFTRVSKDLSGSAVPDEFKKRLERLQRIIESLDIMLAQSENPITGTRVFIGHGRSSVWRVLKDFIQDRLSLPWDEFNRETVAGYMTIERLNKMLSQAAFAFLVLTAEDEHVDKTVHARQNVIHETGLFQGRLGLRRAIVLLEEGCSEFSNIHGLTYIPFPRDNIAAQFEEIRRVLEREGLL